MWLIIQTKLGKTLNEVLGHNRHCSGYQYRTNDRSDQYESFSAKFDVLEHAAYKANLLVNSPFAADKVLERENYIQALEGYTTHG